MKAYVLVHLWSLKHTSLQASSCSHLQCDVLIADTLSSTCKTMVKFRSTCKSYPIHGLHKKNSTIRKICRMWKNCSQVLKVALAYNRGFQRTIWSYGHLHTSSTLSAWPHRRERYLTTFLIKVYAGCIYWHPIAKKKEYSQLCEIGPGR